MVVSFFILIFTCFKHISVSLLMTSTYFSRITLISDDPRIPQLMSMWGRDTSTRWPVGVI